MTAEGSTGAPLRQQIAEAIHAEEICGCDLMGGDDCWHTARAFLTAADAVVALLNLTEEHAWGYDFDEDGDCTMNEVESREVAEMMAGMWRSDAKPLRRYVTPWLPSTPPDTSISEPG